jgi:uncharacterized protein
MLFLLSPAKSLDYTRPLAAEVRKAATQPQFAERSAELIKVLAPMSTARVAQLMSLSDELAALNTARYTAWTPEHTARNSRPAVMAFNGDVYEGLQAASLSMDDLRWAQRHVRILSGLYGLLRPLDRLQPYRLEMSTTLANPGGKDLYAYWGDALAQELNALATKDPSPVIVNLASQEYFRAVRPKALRPRVVACVFEDWKNGQYKVISFFAKRARGLMARYAIQQRVATPQGLQAFEAEGYAFAAGVSSADCLVFRRKVVSASSHALRGGRYNR